MVMETPRPMEEAGTGKSAGGPDIWVSPEGSDFWTGRLDEPRGEGAEADGPLRTLRAAVLLAREWRRRGEAGPVARICLRGGAYPLAFPLSLGPEDSGLRIEAAPGEQPVLDGSVAPAGSESEDGAGRLWTFDLREGILAGEDYQSLFVGGERRAGARFPEEGFLSALREPAQSGPAVGGVTEHNTSLLQGSPRLFADPEAMAPLGEPVGRRLIILNRWLVERLRVTAWDPASGELVFDRPTRLFLKPEASRHGKGVRFYFEDLAGYPAVPGTWTCDRRAGRLYYRPKEGETLEETEVRICRSLQLLRIRGDLEGKRPVRGIEIDGLAFRYADWSEPCNLPVWWDPYCPEGEWDRKESGRHFVETNGANPYRDIGSSAQAAINVPGAVVFEAAEDCALERCEIGHVGFHAVSVGRGCRNLRFSRCRFHDTGAGGLIAEGTGTEGPSHHATGFLRVEDCEIEGTGHVFAGGCGVTLAHVFRCSVVHNHIHDLSYSGISVGWVWGYAENPSYGHRIENNHIHDVGVRGNLSDMGAIYLLGFQPGTFVRGNFIHDVNRAEYGGWGLYPDEGSSGVVFENNVVARCASHCLFEHFGRQNIYRNNVFVSGGLAVFSITEDRGGKFFDWPPQGTFFERNILVATDTPVVIDYLGFFRKGPPFRSRDNLYWDAERQAAPLIVHEKTKPGDPHPGLNTEEREIGLEAFRRPGRDRTSLAADPGFVDPSTDDYRLREDSPAPELGIESIDTRLCGPRRS